MTITMMWGDKEIELTNLEFSIDKSISDDEVLFSPIPSYEQSGAVKLYYYQLRSIAAMMQPYNPKKSKLINKLAERHNPIRILGLL